MGKKSYALGDVFVESREAGFESFSSTPDLVVDLNGQKMVFDAKYKNLGSSPKNSDVYQVVAGAKLLDAKRVGLVYPGTDHEAKVARWKLRIPGIPDTLETYSYNLAMMGSADGLETLKRQLIRWLNDNAASHD
ncbi:hypothetical protein JKI95_03135 [Corynebacterium aquatimens]|uniref:5-methylcytosine restriction system specificity protein McrC n=1 Tax=Corynebacterium aquatimens TaxID=1190508 RepID=UPI003313DF98|nr:hypothetical protein JKI95_03135 [Corynebacterium aquatimens]